MKTTIAIKIKKKMMVDITIANNNNDDFNQHNEYNITTITIKHDDFSVKNLLIRAVFFILGSFTIHAFNLNCVTVLESHEQVSCTQFFLKSERSWVVKPVNIPYVILWYVKLFFQDQREFPMVNSTFHLVNSNFYMVNF